MLNDPTRPAQELWAHLFANEAWPSGWRVTWVRSLRRRAVGLADFSDRCIYLSERAATQFGDVIETLVHEFVHVRCGRSFHHCKEFRNLENRFRARLGFGPAPMEPPRPKGTWEVAEEGDDYVLLSGTTEAGWPAVRLEMRPRRRASRSETRVQHGQKLRRPRLPDLPPGEADEIMIRVPG